MNPRGRRSRGRGSTTSDRPEQNPDQGRQGSKSKVVGSQLAPGAVVYKTDTARQLGAVGDDADDASEWDWEGQGKSLAEKREDLPVSRSQWQEMKARERNVSTEHRNDNRDVVASMVAAHLRRQNQGARAEDTAGNPSSSQNDAALPLRGEDDIADAPASFSIFALGGSFDDSDDDNDDDGEPNNDEVNVKGNPLTSVNDAEKLQDYWTGQTDYSEPAPSQPSDADMSTIFGPTPSTPVSHRDQHAHVAEAAPERDVPPDAVVGGLGLMTPVNMTNVEFRNAVLSRMMAEHMHTNSAFILNAFVDHMLLRLEPVRGETAEETIDSLIGVLNRGEAPLQAVFPMLQDGHQGGWTSQSINAAIRHLSLLFMFDGAGRHSVSGESAGQ
ncbi:hypothetical protein CONPUDRAFT_77156 [Coniophora puteana RWD-64-598 SS2]|uniref:Uncharacterized protein n=1 Tax=Coniophora puteana (strain RWD-64-598) TaxID=741705 RepID=A0A5M3M8G9_CONPW|nr:uncharacterized protein CONPUDRAFT_77156 [Coniophora puteana RWD-64-598 SS2]EIW75469.1 hypothetical protein CONPUDRAFT_77156 [Coniophora puteana RWD-64-598 SS2]